MIGLFGGEDEFLSDLVFEFLSFWRARTEREKNVELTFAKKKN